MLDKTYKKIEKYLKENFSKGKEIVLNKKLDRSTADVWGINSITVFVKEEGNIIEYCPEFKN